MTIYRILVVIFLSITFQAQAGDMGFRYKDGVCKNSKGEQGYNTLYFGQCTDFSGVKMNLFEFEDIDFSGSKFENADLTASKFINVNMTGTNLKVANLSGAEFEDVNFERADLENARLSNSTLFFVTFKKARIQGIVADKINGQELDFSEADLSEAQFNQANLVGSNFSGVFAKSLTAKKANLRDSNLQGAQFIDSDLSGAQFNKAKAPEVQFQNTNLKKATFTSANLQKAQFLASDIRRSNFMTANTKDVAWTGSIFSKKTQFEYSEVEAKALGMIYKVADVFAEMGGFLIYKLKVEGKMTDTNVRNTCEKEDLKVPCVNESGGQFSDDKCLDVGWKDSGSPMLTLSRKICANQNPNRCDKLNDGTFMYMGGKWNGNDDTCGAQGGGWCVAGSRRQDLFTLCAEPQ